MYSLFVIDIMCDDRLNGTEVLKRVISGLKSLMNLSFTRYQI